MRLAIVVVFVAGCELLANIPSYTGSSADGAVGDGVTDDGSLTDSPIDAAPECTMSTQCTAPETCIRGECGLCDNTGGSLTIVGLTLVGNQQYNALCFGATGTASTLAYFRVTSMSGAYGIGGFSCTIDVRRSTLVQQTQMGGYIQQGSLQLINSIVMGSARSGIFLTGDVAARIEHSTIAGNTSTDMSAAGITCGAANETIVSSIIWGNVGTTPIDPACAINYSVVEPSYVGGVGNVRTDPMFVAAGDFHIQATSPARGAADPASTVTVDRDFQPRPQGTPPGPNDSGADEVP